jgi:hypothetical protein
METTDFSPNLDSSRYAASARLSVAPMMDWIDGSRIPFVSG